MAWLSPSATLLADGGLTYDTVPRGGCLGCIAVLSFPVYLFHGTMVSGRSWRWSGLPGVLLALCSFHGESKPMTCQQRRVPLAPRQVSGLTFLYLVIHPVWPHPPLLTQSIPHDLWCPPASLCDRQLMGWAGGTPGLSLCSGSSLSWILPLPVTKGTEAGDSQAHRGSLVPKTPSPATEGP